MLVLLTLGAFWAGRAAISARIPLKTCRFFHYVEATRRSDASASFFEQVLFGLFLASTDSCEKESKPVGLRPS
ncbi:MAG: hypothetical protein HY235_22290 [Acidobacteria bacterium]|nr:hypothetical protein [Acidobacteriota bacterium]